MIGYAKDRNGLYYLEITSGIHSKESRHRLSLSSLTQNSSSSAINRCGNQPPTSHPWLSFPRKIITTSLRDERVSLSRI